MTMVPTTGEEDDHDRFKQRSEAGYSIVYLVIVYFRDLQEHFGELSGLLADVNHADDHRWEDATRLKRVDNGLALFHAVVHLHDRVGDHGVSGGFSRNSEGLKNRNAARDESAQRAAKPRDCALACQIAEQGHPSA